MVKAYQYLLVLCFAVAVGLLLHSGFGYPTTVATPLHGVSSQQVAETAKLRTEVGLCGATYMGEGNVFVTAAHCLPQNGGVEPLTVEFEGTFYDVTGWGVHKNHPDSTSGQRLDSRHDVGWVQVSKTPETTQQKFIVGEGTEPGPYLVGGWVLGEGNALHLYGCLLQNDQLTGHKGVLQAACGLEKGSSGSALWSLSGDTPVLVGVISSVNTTTKTNKFTPAARVQELLQQK